MLLVAADVAHRHAGFFSSVLDQLDKLLAPLLGQGRKRDADYLAVVGGVEPELRLLQRFLDGSDRVAIVRLHQQQSRFGGMDLSQLQERSRRAVIIDLDSLHQRRSGPAGTDCRELMMQNIDRLLHLDVGFLGDVLNHGQTARAGGLNSAAIDESADLLAHDYLLDIALMHEVENDDGQVVLHAHGYRGRVHHLQTLVQDLKVAKVGVTLS